jgi:hypothetical protein
MRQKQQKQGFSPDAVKFAFAPVASRHCVLSKRRYDLWKFWPSLPARQEAKAK